MTMLVRGTPVFGNDEGRDGRRAKAGSHFSAIFLNNYRFIIAEIIIKGKKWVYFGLGGARLTRP